jgi:hypothetical protein
MFGGRATALALRRRRAPAERFSIRVWAYATVLPWRYRGNTGIAGKLAVSLLKMASRILLDV